MRHPTSFILLTLLIVVLFVLNLLLGTVSIPVRDVLCILFSPSTLNLDSSTQAVWSNIIWNSRIPQALTALMAGAGLAVRGLQMQTSHH